LLAVAAAASETDERYKQKTGRPGRSNQPNHTAVAATGSFRPFFARRLFMHRIASEAAPLPLPLPAPPSACTLQQAPPRSLHEEVEPAERGEATARGNDCARLRPRARSVWTGRVTRAAPGS